MLACRDNVVPLLRSPAPGRNLIQSNDVGLSRDLACLRELSLQLETAQRLFARHADNVTELCDATLYTNIAGAADNFLAEVHALQIGTEALIGVMAAYEAGGCAREIPL